MATAEYEALKKALREAPTPEARKEAAKRFREYEEAQKAAGKKGSKPTLVSLGYKKDYPTSIDVEDIPGEIEKNPAFFEHLKEIVEED